MGPYSTDVKEQHEADLSRKKSERRGATGATIFFFCFQLDVIVDVLHMVCSYRAPSPGLLIQFFNSCSSI
jgi:hypothetical protein